MNVPTAGLFGLVDAFSDRRVLVLGDVMLDEYLVGAPTRVSREAPVLVLEQRRRFVRPGGGANPAVNIRSLGATPILVGVIGDDATGGELCGSLSELGIASDHLVRELGAETTRKTRVLAETPSSYGQQLLRIDRVAPTPSGKAHRTVTERIAHLGPGVEALLLSDYKGGVIGQAAIDAARRIAREHGTLLTVDSQGGLDRFFGFGMVKCNRPDAEAFLGRSLESQRDYCEAGSTLVRDLELGCLMITLGADGMSVTTAESSELVPAANRTEVWDVTGAGDTVVAVATLALLAGATPIQAAELANLAAGEVVRRLGVATVSAELLRELLRVL